MKTYYFRLAKQTWFENSTFVRQMTEECRPEIRNAKPHNREPDGFGDSSDRRMKTLPLVKTCSHEGL